MINCRLLIASCSETCGGPTCSYLSLICYSLMMLILWCFFLLLAHFVCHVYPVECNTKYEYTHVNKELCCNKCPPGERMEERCKDNLRTLCEPCNPDFFMDEYSIELECKRCTQCTKEHMVYKVNCSSSSDAVCDCESGYKCSSKPCTHCVKIPTTAPPLTTTILPTSTYGTRKNEQHSTPFQNIVWITLCLCCVCILLTCFILISRPTPACGWGMLASTGSFWGSKKTSAESSQCTEDEEVPMPVQEVCGYKEWQEEV